MNFLRISSKSFGMATKKPWRKVLYEKQSYPDNYTDKKMFLRDLRRNVDFKEVTFLEAVSGANLLLQEFCSVVAFVLIYFYLVNDWISPSTVFNWTSILTTIGFMYFLLLYNVGIRQKLGHDLRTVLIFIVFGQLFSPVLHTLTDTISTDTIYTTSFFMMLIHLIFYDYGVSAAIVSNSLSLSASVFASICLASRLSSAYHAFILMTIATEMFVLFPLFKNEIQKPVSVTILLLIFNTYFLYQIGILVLILFWITVFLVTIVCPLLFVHYQKFKDNIYGPWDEAVVDDTDITFIQL